MTTNKRFGITSCIVILTLLIFAPPTVGQVLYGNGKLKNASGTITSTVPGAYNGPIDSIRYSGYFDVASTDVFYIYYTDQGSISIYTIGIPPFAPGRTVHLSTFSPSTFNPSITFSAADAGGGKVNCVFADTVFASTDGGISWHVSYINTVTFSYTRDRLQLKLSAGLASDNAEVCFLNSFLPPAAGFSYRYWVNGNITDSARQKFYLRFYKKYIVTDSKGKQIDSVLQSNSDTTEQCPIVPKPDSYLARLTFIPDSMLVVPDPVGITFHFNINPGIYQSQCNGLPFLSFDATHSNSPDTVESPAQAGKGWQGGGGIGVIQDSGTIFINGGTMRFHGIMKIDTIKSLVDANGEFYVFTRLPFTQKSGAWKLGTGNWPTFSYSCKGLVAIAQSILSSDSIGGFPFRIDSIYFITDSLGLSGVRLGATVRIPKVTIGGECGSNFNSKTSPDISLAPIEITRNGIGGALHVSNVGFGDAFCVKDLFGSYYEAQDSLSFGAEFKAPFVDKLALSAGWVHGKWDAISFNVQQATGGIPIGQTGMLLSGVRGSASNWTNGPLKCSIGGTFDDVTHKFMEWEGDLGYQEPSMLFGSLKLSFLNVPPLGWQLVISGSDTLDWDHYVKFSGSLQEGTLGNGYVFNGKGNLTFTWSPKKDLIGKGSGSYSIPKLFKNNLSSITDFINSYLPIKIASAEMYLKSGVVKANISFTIISAHLAIDLNLPSSDPNFIDFGRGTIPISIAHPAAKNQIASLTLDTIHVPPNTAFAVIRIRSNGMPSASSVIDPSNTLHANAPTDSLVQYRTDMSTNHGFWVLKNPAAGVWKLSMPQRIATDTVDAEAEPMEEALQFTAIQIGKHVTLHWTPLSGAETADVTAYLDDSSGGNRGFLIAFANDKNGTLSFDLNDSMPLCQYYLYAARDNGAYISQSYSSLTLDNSKTSALAPTNPMLIHLGGDTILLRWTPTTSTGLLAYAIKVTEANGMDSIYGSASVNDDSAVIVVQNQHGKRISLDAFGNGIQSCWSPSVSATSWVPTTNNNQALPTLGLEVWPNPSSGKGELNFTLSERNMIRITIFDVLGNEIISPVQSVLDEGKHTSGFDLSSLASGTYYCRAQFIGRVETVKLVIER